MELSQLRYVVAVADLGSISAAARHLYVGQPSLSKSIKELENELGRPLFRRTARGVELTPSGRDFLSHARSIVAQMDAVTELYRPPQNNSLRLSVCVPCASYVSHAYFRWAGRAAKQDFRLQYRETTSFSAMDAVVAEEAQVGIVRYPVARADYSEGLVGSRGLHLAPLWDYHMVVLVQNAHPLAAAGRICPEQLAPFTEISHGNLTPIVPPDESDLSHEKEGGAMLIYDRAGEFDALRHMTGAYIWASPVPAEILARQELCALSCEDAPLYRDSLIWKGHLSSQAAAFADEVRKVIHELME